MFGTRFPTFPAVAQCVPIDVRSPPVRGASTVRQQCGSFPTSCFVPAVENDENANMGSTGARNRSGARGSGKDRNDAASGTARNQRHARGRPSDGGAGRPSGLASGARVGCRGPSLQQNGAWRHVSAVPHPAKWNMADAIDDSVNEGLCSANPDLDPTKHENQAAYPDAPVRAGRLAGHVGAAVGHRLRAGEIRGPRRAPSVRIRSGRCFVDPVMDLIRGTPDYTWSVYGR